MSSLVEPKFTRKEDILNHDNSKKMVETRSWKAATVLVQDKRFRVCHKRDETIARLVAGCKVLANSKYLSRHYRALVIMAVAWAKE